MERVRLTNERIGSFQCEPGKSQSFLWDTEAVGLAVRVTPRGAKSFIFESKLHRSTIRITIGDVRVWLLNSVWKGKSSDKEEIRRGAREEAGRLKTLIDQGVDPRQERAEKEAVIKAKDVESLRLAEQEARQSVTLVELWDIYVAARKSRWGERHYKDHINVARRGGEVKGRGDGQTIPAPLASLLDTKLVNLDDDRIANWLDSEAKTRPTSTSLTFRLLRGCLHWCESESQFKGLVPSGVLSGRKVRDAIPKKSVKDDCLQREQLPLWFEHVQAIGNPVQSAYLQSLLITGARREELADVKWSDIDFKWKTVVIRDKVEGARVIPLTPHVESLLNVLPKINEWVFSSARSASGRIQEPRIAHNKAIADAGLPQLSLHGLRRSFGTLAEWCEVPVGVVAQIMGHKPSAIAEKHYRRRPIDLLRSWHIKIEAWILQEARGKHFAKAS